MDRLLYVAMSGAKETLRAQTVNNHNLANASTTGFRADLSAFQSRAVVARAMPRASMRRTRRTGWDAVGGAQMSTGRDLDVAVQGDGLIAVQGADGTRGLHARRRSAASMPTGQLMTGDRPCRCWATAARSACRRTRRSSSRRTARSRSCRRARAPRPPSTSAASSWSIPPPSSSSAAKTACSACSDGSDAPADATVRRFRRARVEQRQRRRCDGQHDRARAPLRSAGQGHAHRRRQRAPRRRSCSCVIG